MMESSEKEIKWQPGLCIMCCRNQKEMLDTFSFQEQRGRTMMTRYIDLPVCSECKEKRGKASIRKWKVIGSLLIIFVLFNVIWHYLALNFVGYSIRDVVAVIVSLLSIFGGFFYYLYVNNVQNEEFNVYVNRFIQGGGTITRKGL